MTRPTTSVVVRAYNEEAHIGRLLSGIVKQSVETPEIILVDSGSTDATVAIASRFPVKVVTIAPDEFTFGRSLNLGCSEATGEFLVIASAHVYPIYADWLQQLIVPFEDPKVAMTYGQQRGDSTTKFSEHRIFEAWFPDDDLLEQDHPFANNANSAVQREVWEAFPFDESLTGLEDVAWAARAMDEGYKVVYVPEAPVIHVHDEGPKQVFNRYRREAMALRRVFPSESMGFGEMVRLIAGNIWADLRAARRQGLLRQEAASILQFRTLQFVGTYRGFGEAPQLTDQLRRTLYYPAPATHGTEDHAQRERELIDYSHLDGKNDRTPG